MNITNKKGEIIMKGIILAISIVVGVILLVSWIGAWLWNITLPYIFGLPTVEWWHILALMILLWVIIPSRRK